MNSPDLSSDGQEVNSHSSPVQVSRHSESERINDNDTPFQDDDDILPIIGLGGSAGSIPVLQEFFAHVRPDLGIAYVVVIHLSPDYESALAQVLGARTSMPVIQVEDTVEVKPNCVYVIPPLHHLSMQDGRIHLREPQQETGKRVAVDLFFRTLAVTHRSKAMAVVLSGMDSDGAIGIKRVKEAGGVTVAQEPTEAEHEGMPRSAIETGMVDWILPVRDIAAKVAEWIHNEERIHLPPSLEGPASPEEVDETALREILAFLQARTGHDFQHYKRATILRRIGRRLQVNSLESLPQYVNFLRTHPGEAGALLQDLLISVTNFFRDPDSFLALDATLPRLLRNREPNDTVRVWVVGCATGEEAYSLAMLLDEYAATLDAAPGVQIFATDLDEQALLFAREGVYPASIVVDVSPERLRRYFVFDQGRYRVKKEMRERVLFAPHNVLQDAPFSRIDLVSCRNLLIYFNRQAQERVFHFALKPGGLLFLGGSESADDNLLFVLQDRAHRIYEKQAVSRTPLALPNLIAPALLRPIEVTRSTYLSPPVTPIAKPNTPTLSYSELHLKLLEQAAPPSVLVDANYDIVHLSEHAGQFLHVTGGEMSANLLTMITPALRVELRVALFRAVQSGEEINVPPISVEVYGQTRRIRLRVRPMREEERQSDLSNFVLVIFEDATADAQQEYAPSALPAPSDQSEVVRSLEAELEHLRSYLRSSIEQYETSAEELKASNEELQALNEEQRSAAEELETSREEIQAGNEELTTVNSELKAKIEELGRANSDLQNLMQSTDIATVFLNRNLHIKRYTPPAVELFHFIPTDTGRPLADLKHDFTDESFIQDATQVLQKLTSISREVGTNDGRCFLLRISPYRTIEDYIDGIVLTFVDITERRKAEEDLREREAELARVQRIGGVGGVHIDVTGGLTGSRSPEYRRLHGLSLDVAQETHEEWLARVHPDDRKQADTTLREALAGTGDRYESEYRIIRPNDGQERWISARLTIERDKNRQPVRLVGAHIDITQRKHVEEALRQSEEQFRALVTASSDAIYQMGSDWKEMRNLKGMDFLADTETASGIWLERYIPEETRPQVLGAIQRAISTKSTFELEHPVIQLDGTVGWTFSRAVPLLNEQGEITSWFGAATDITQRKRAEEAMRESEARFRRLFTNNMVPMFIWTPEGEILDANDGFLDLIGYTRQEFEAGQCRWDALTPPELQERDAEAVAEVMAQGLCTPYEKQFRHKDGHLVPFLVGAGVFDYNNFSGVCYAIDLTARARAEKALRASEEKYRTLFDSIDEGFCIIEMLFDEQGEAVDYRFIEVNDAFEQQTGLQNVVNQRGSELTPNTESYWREAYAKVAQTGEPLRFENYHGATERWYDAYASRIDGGGSHQVAIVFADITERKHQEQRQAFLLKLSDVLRPLLDPIEIHAAVTATALDHFGVDRCYYCEIEDNQAIIRRDAARGDLPSVVGVYPLDHFPLFKTMMETGSPLIVEDANTTGSMDEELRQLCAQMKIVSFINIPIIKSGEYRGNLCITQTSPRRWTNFELRLAEEIAERTWTAVERARAEEATRASEEKYRALFDSMDEGYCIIQMMYDEHGKANDWRYLQVNRAFELNNGLHNAEGKTIRELAPDIESKWMEIYDQVAQTGTPIRFEEDSVALGRIFTLYAFRIGEPDQRKVAVIFTDITHRKESEEAVQKSEARLHAIANLVPDLLWSNDPSGDTDWYNEQWLNYTGQTLEEATNYGWHDVIHPDDRDNSARNFQEAVDRGEPLRQEHRIRRHDGQHHWFLVQARPLKDQNNQITRWFGSATDIQDVKEAQQAVLESEERLRIAIDAGELATWDWDVERDQIHWNERHFLLFGMTPREGVMHERDFSSHIHTDDFNFVEARLGAAVDNAGSFEAEFRIIREDNGEVRWMNGYGRTTESRDGRATRMVGGMFDSTERRQAQEILQRAHEDLEKRVEERTRELKQALQQVRREIEQRRELEAARGELMRRIVNTQEEERGRISRELHDNLGQHLTALMLGLQSLEMQISTITGDKRQVPQLDNLRSLVDGLMRAAHDQARQLRPAELDAMGLEAALGQYIRDWSARTGVEIDFQAVGWETRPSPEVETTLYRVVQEALTNVARHAEATQVGVIIERRGGTASAIIEDNGRGFDTQQSTRRLGVVGMQERLSIVGGTLEIESAPGEGTAIFARIPLEPNATNN